MTLTLTQHSYLRVSQIGPQRKKYASDIWSHTDRLLDKRTDKLSPKGLGRPKRGTFITTLDGRNKRRGKKLTCNATCCKQRRYCSDSSRSDRMIPTDRYRILQAGPYLGCHRPITVHWGILKNKRSICQNLITQIYCWFIIVRNGFT